MLTGHVDWQEQARLHLPHATQSLLGTLTDPMIDDPRIHHVRYTDLVADPIGTLRQFYHQYDMPFGPDTEREMRAWLASNKADRYGKFRYNTAILDTDIDALHETFAPYRARFGIDIENKT